MEENNVDLVILGGGLAGMTLALQVLKENPSASVVVLEKVPGPLPEAACKVGESTVEVGAHYYADVLGLREHLETKQLPKFGLRYFFGGDKTNIVNRAELGSRQPSPTGSFQLDRGILENFLREEVVRRGAVFHAPAVVKEVELSTTNERHLVHADVSKVRQSFQARWVVDASGRNAFLKRRLNLQKPWGHQCNAAWWRVHGKVDVSSWGDSAEWKKWENGVHARYYSTNHLMGKGYWVWVIPLSSGLTSIGIVADETIHPSTTISTFEKSMAWLKEHEPQCFAAHEGREIADFLFLRNFSYGCKQVYSAERWALTGEAGLFLDPFYSPGSDFIAMSNTFITNLITRDLNNKPIEALSIIYDKLLIGLAEQTLLAYQDQYRFFGNPVVMPLKIVWDYGLYWSFVASVFFENGYTDLKVLKMLGEQLEEMKAYNLQMQTFFREWADRFDPDLKTGSYNLYRSPRLLELNRQLSQPPPGDFTERLTKNLSNLKDLAAEIVSFAQDYNAPKIEGIITGVPKEKFLGVFLQDVGEAIGHIN